MYSYNKGEWSEFYSLLQILIEWEITGCDEDLKLYKDKKWPVFMVNHCKDNTNKKNKKDIEIITFEKSEDDVLIKFEKNTRTVSILKIKILADIIFKKIKAPPSKAAFEISEVNKLLNEMYEPKIKQNASSKIDLT